ncbi:Flp pilus assembly protein CpaB [Solimonas soli]|uniref:Flp pilus assembly protein CpaB n=1 Tax=Solimonas soli TaxID=413479 RepID=UPI00047F49AB|nr:Flp pilus assembly protein CpaB [Solimonas soli]
MSSTALKIFAAVSVLAAIILAAVGYRMSREYAQKSEAAQQQVKQQEAQQSLAVVAVKPLAAYQPIARDDVALVPVSVRPGDPFTSIDEVVGKAPLIDVDAGAPVTRRYFREGNLLTSAIPAGFQAVAITTSDVLAVGGFLRPGDVVDVLIYLHDGNDVPKSQSRVLLKDVRVLAYLDQLVDRPQGVDDKNRNQQPPRTAVLAISEKDTTKLMLGSSVGELRLALHGKEGRPGETTPAGGDDAGVAAAPLAGPDVPSCEPKPGAKPPESPTACGPDRIITTEELGHIKNARGRVGGDGAPVTRIEVIRGNERVSVTAK